MSEDKEGDWTRLKIPPPVAWDIELTPRKSGSTLMVSTPPRSTRSLRLYQWDAENVRAKVPGHVLPPRTMRSQSMPDEDPKPAQVKKHAERDLQHRSKSANSTVCGQMIYDCLPQEMKDQGGVIMITIPAGNSERSSLPSIDWRTVTPPWEMSPASPSRDDHDQKDAVKSGPRCERVPCRKGRVSTAVFPSKIPRKTNKHCDMIECEVVTNDRRSTVSVSKSKSTIVLSFGKDVEAPRGCPEIAARKPRSVSLPMSKRSQLAYETAIKRHRSKIPVTSEDVQDRWLAGSTPSSTVPKVFPHGRPTKKQLARDEAVLRRIRPRIFEVPKPVVESKIFKQHAKSRGQKQTTADVFPRAASTNIRFKDSNLPFMLGSWRWPTGSRRVAAAASSEGIDLEPITAYSSQTAIHRKTSAVALGESRIPRYRGRSTIRSEEGQRRPMKSESVHDSSDTPTDPTRSMIDLKTAWTDLLSGDENSDSEGTQKSLFCPKQEQFQVPWKANVQFSSLRRSSTEQCLRVQTQSFFSLPQTIEITEIKDDGEDEGDTQFGESIGRDLCESEVVEQLGMEALDCHSECLGRELDDGLLGTRPLDTTIDKETHSTVDREEATTFKEDAPGVKEEASIVTKETSLISDEASTPREAFAISDIYKALDEIQSHCLPEPKGVLVDQDLGLISNLTEAREVEEFIKLEAIVLADSSNELGENLAGLSDVAKGEIKEVEGDAVEIVAQVDCKTWDNLSDVSPLRQLDLIECTLDLVGESITNKTPFLESPGVSPSGIDFLDANEGTYETDDQIRDHTAFEATHFKSSDVEMDYSSTEPPEEIESVKEEIAKHDETKQAVVCESKRRNFVFESACVDSYQSKRPRRHKVEESEIHSFKSEERFLSKHPQDNCEVAQNLNVTENTALKDESEEVIHVPAREGPEENRSDAIKDIIPIQDESLTENIYDEESSVRAQIPSALSIISEHNEDFDDIIHSEVSVELINNIDNSESMDGSFWIKEILDQQSEPGTKIEYDARPPLPEDMHKSWSLPRLATALPGDEGRDRPAYSCDILVFGKESWNSFEGKKFRQERRLAERSANKERKKKSVDVYEKLAAECRRSDALQAKVRKLSIEKNRCIGALEAELAEVEADNVELRSTCAAQARERKSFEKKVRRETSDLIARIGQLQKTVTTLEQELRLPKTPATVDSAVQCQAVPLTQKVVEQADKSTQVTANVVPAQSVTSARELALQEELTVLRATSRVHKETMAQMECNQRSLRNRLHQAIVCVNKVKAAEAAAAMAQSRGAHRNSVSKSAHQGVSHVVEPEDDVDNQDGDQDEESDEKVHEKLRFVLRDVFERRSWQRMRNKHMENERERERRTAPSSTVHSAASQPDLLAQANELPRRAPAPTRHHAPAASPIAQPMPAARQSQRHQRYRQAQPRLPEPTPMPTASRAQRHREGNATEVLNTLNKLSSNHDVSSMYEDINDLCQVLCSTYEKSEHVKTQLEWLLDHLMYRLTREDELDGDALGVAHQGCAKVRRKARTVQSAPAMFNMEMRDHITERNLHRRDAPKQSYFNL